MSIPERTANREVSTEILEPTRDPPSSARVVVIGAGIMGASVAYHLTRLGMDDVVVVERGRLTNGTTWHAAGLVAQVRGSHALTELARSNAAVYESLPAETGVATGLRRVGSLTVARTPARMQEYLAGLSMARDAGIEAHAVTPAEIQERWPPAEVRDVVGGTFFPTDATVNPGDAALALAKGARDRGAHFVQGVEVTGFDVRSGHVVGVRTDVGRIETEAVVVAAGLWTSEVARLAGVSVPLYPAEHVWVVTESASGADERLPILRDLDGFFYVRHYQGGYMVGAFEPRGKPRRPADIDPTGFAEFGPDWPHFEPVLSNARERIPELHDIGFRRFLRAPESFTPDSNFHLGEIPELPGMFIAAGMNSQGIIYAPGAGRALAEWIVSGGPTMDLVEVDVARSGRWSNNRAWLHARTAESLGRLYAMHWPGLQPGTARGVRRLALETRLRAAGAAMGEVGGWERPAWFEPAATGEPRWSYDFARPSWFPALEQEMAAARTGVALFELSTYSKFLVQGPAVVDGLQRLCSADIDVAVGRIVYTAICNDRGGIEMDPTVTRLGDERFLVVAPTLAQRRIEGLLRNGLPRGATVTDVTSGLSVLHVAGPRSRELLAGLMDVDLSNDAFPFMTAREVDIAWARGAALRLSFTGELGWELYVPGEFVAGVYDELVTAGARVGLRHAGAFAFDALRVERGFRSWGHDIGPVDDPFTSGLTFAVRLDKEVEFIGRPALEAAVREPAGRRLVVLKLGDPGVTLWHGESLLRDGSRVGHVSSGAYGFTLGTSVGLAWVHEDGGVDDEWLGTGEWAVEIQDRLVPASVRARPFYDPSGTRLRS